MGIHRSPKRVLSGEPENAGRREPEEKAKEWTECLAEDRQVFGITGNWNTPTLYPGIWYNNIVCEGGGRFMARG